MTAQFNYTDRAYPNSSWVDAAYYDRSTRVLAVVCGGRHYFYSDVPAYVFEKALTATSGGDWYNGEVKGVYRSFNFGGNIMPTDPVNYVPAANHLTTPRRVTVPAAQTATTKPQQFSIEVEFDPQHPVTATSLEEAIRKFRENPMNYITLNVTGVTKV